jgi:stage V sporulation protein B
VYAIIVAVFIFAFSEELGYVIYDTYAAGRYIGFLAPVIPLMYLDHVTDSMLKGIGEHVYSMWINIADSFLSVFLVWVMIPIFDIVGYAMVIILMELFNFTFSYLRLRKRIDFTFNPCRAFILPSLVAIMSAILAKRAFIFVGRVATPLWLAMQIMFGACVCISLICGVTALSEWRKRKCDL